MRHRTFKNIYIERNLQRERNIEKKNNVKLENEHSIFLLSNNKTHFTIYFVHTFYVY